MDDKLFLKLSEAAKQSVGYAQGKKIKGVRVHRISVPDVVDVKAIRTDLGMTQQVFSETFGFSLSGLRKWESKQRQPEGPARVLLKMIGKDPMTVIHLASQ